MTRLRRIILLGSVSLLLPSIFIYDVIRAVVDLELTGIRLIREVLLAWVFLSGFLLIADAKKRALWSPAREIGRLLMFTVALCLVLAIVVFSEASAEGSEGTPSAGSVFGVLWGSVAGVLSGVLAMYVLIVVRSLVLFKRTKTTRRNLIVFLSFLLTASILTSPALPIAGSLLSPVLLGFTIVAIVVISFRQNWIVYLSRREKFYTLGYTALLFLSSLFLAALLYQNGGVIREMEEFSKPVLTFGQLNALLATIYFGMTFISTLFHLPTAEVFERKQTELNSLQNLTKLTTQVLDFDTLVDTVAQLTQEVCGARAVWLELVTRDSDGAWHSRIVAHRNITPSDVARVDEVMDPALRPLILQSGSIVIVDDVWTDKRTSGLKALGLLRGSLVSIPLRAPSGVIGVLHASKDLENGFDKDDIDVLTTFGDHVTIAIENARLISQSIEQERLQQELLVAQRMQRQLLPQHAPAMRNVDYAAMSQSSMEVGGDYYDIIRLSDTKWGIAVGDVSGKGVSAAFYMAEVKGIVLSLSKVCSSPKELLIRANNALLGSLERRSFVSLVYAILDTRRASILLARAGHCPILLVRGEHAQMIRPGGLGLGMAESTVFEGATEEQLIRLESGDVCLFYTDGITEARDEDGDEYGYERLTRTVLMNRGKSAEKIKEDVLSSVRSFVGHTAYRDDMTLVVLKWMLSSGVETRSETSPEGLQENKKETFV